MQNEMRPLRESSAQRHLRINKGYNDRAFIRRSQLQGANHLIRCWRIPEIDEYGLKALPCDFLDGALAVGTADDMNLQVAEHAAHETLQLVAGADQQGRQW